MIVETPGKSNDKLIVTGWRRVRLGDHVTKIGSGLTPTGGQSSYLEKGIPLIRSQNVHMNRFVSDGLVFISVEQDELMRESRVYPGDVLLNITGASIGRVCVVPDNVTPANVNQHVTIIRGDSSFIPHFLSFYISRPEFQKFIFDSQAGATRQALTKGMIENFRIPLPPLAEQKRIVAILNQQMAAVEQALQAAQTQLEVAQALPSTYLRQVFDSPEASKWPQKTLGDVCGHITDGTHHTPTYVSSGVPFLSVKDIRETGISFDNCQYISKEEHGRLIQRCQPEQGDVLYTKVGTTGIAKSIDIERDFSIFVSVALLKLKAEIKPEYLQEVLNSPLGRKQAEDLTQGMANRNLVIKDIRKIRIPVPSISQQEQIVAKITEQKLITQRLIQTSQGQLNTIEKLPATLLRRAFNGEL